MSMGEMTAWPLQMNPELLQLKQFAGSVLGQDEDDDLLFRLLPKNNFETK